MHYEVVWPGGDLLGIFPTYWLPWPVPGFTGRGGMPAGFGSAWRPWLPRLSRCRLQSGSSGGMKK